MHFCFKFATNRYYCFLKRLIRVSDTRWNIAPRLASANEQIYSTTANSYITEKTFYAVLAARQKQGRARNDDRWDSSYLFS